MTQELKLLNSYEVFDYTPDMVKESREKNNGKVIMKGILQKADTLNQNGRIYPLSVLEREVRNYQKFITENRSLGECVPPGTEIYTSDGWKRIEDISDNEAILTLNIQARETQFQHITRKVVLPFDGEMINLRNEATIDMCLTPSHKMLLWDENESPYTLTAQEFYDGWTSGDARVTRSSVSGMNVDYSRKDYDLKDLEVDKTEYSGTVYCVTVPNATWLMRHNGRVCWTHNCDHPDSSVVNLKNVSHIIREAHIDKGVVYGTVELLDTPSGKILQSLVESGVKLGISSRGVGTTKKQGDYHVVQDDFQLICWDYVSEPSTPGAFMLPEGKTISDVDLRKVFNRSDRIDRIINDILTFGK